LPATASNPKVGLVIGAGGTSRAAIYALKSIGVETVYLFNRTMSSAEKLQLAFPSANVQIIDQLGQWPQGAPSVIVSTVPASATRRDGSATDALELTSAIFVASEGVVVDMAYRPSLTPLLALAADVAGGWKTVRGLDVLLEQAYAQFRIWTGRECPRRAVAAIVTKAYESQ
jgi:pentafunctional AROM polypeptide